ncbi:hypothetical protein QOT17_013785 [Balamuthia mandrillaris]
MSISDVKCQELRCSLVQPSSSAQSGPLSSGAIPPASGTPSPTITSTTLPMDRLDVINQALSELHASQADHDRLLVKQTSDASSLSDHIDHINAKLETFADELFVVEQRRGRKGEGEEKTHTQPYGTLSRFMTMYGQTQH